MKRRDAAWHAENSIIIGGDVTGVVQSGSHGATVVNRQSEVSYQDGSAAGQPDIRELVDHLRALLEASAPAETDPGEYEAALQAIEAGADDPKQHRFSITGALALLTGAAGMVAGWSDAVAALQHAIAQL